MSSPLSNLKKTKKAPISTGSHSNGIGSAPFRHGSDGLLDEVTSRMVSKKATGTSKSQGFISDPAPGAPSDIDLMQSMLSRIALLEKQVQMQTKQIYDKDKRIDVLEEKCRLYQKINEEETHSPNYVKELKAKITVLQKQISEMEEFLLDYGMVWVGNDEEEEDFTDKGTMTQTPGGIWNQGTSVADIRETTVNPYGIDFDKIIENIHELNAIAGDGEAKIEKTTSGARFKAPDMVQLILYKNGIVMFEGPFRSYEDETTKICIADLIDGYFPSELQQKFPDGVPFKVIDKRDIFYQKPGSKAFIGDGQSLGGEATPSKLVPSIVHSSNNSYSSNKQPLGKVESEIPGTKLTADQFLSHLPSSVIRGGKVIDIRSSLSNAIKGSDSDERSQVTVVETAAMAEIKDRLEMDESTRPPSGKNITTLRIKDIDNHTYVLKMRFTDKIKDVKTYLNNLRKSSSESYDLVTTFPSRAYDNPNETLYDAGLTPNAAIHIRARK